MVLDVARLGPLMLRDLVVQYRWQAERHHMQHAQARVARIATNETFARYRFDMLMIIDLPVNVQPILRFPPRLDRGFLFTIADDMNLEWNAVDLDQPRRDPQQGRHVAALAKPADEEDATFAAIFGGRPDTVFVHQ